MTNDPMITPSEDRFVVFPVKYHDMWDMYKDAIANLWTVEEIDFEQDMKDWSKLNAGEREYLTHVLAFFAASDGIVNENLAVNLYKMIQVPEARQFYAIQIQQEAIHSETYSMMIDTYFGQEEATKALNALNEYPSIRNKADWALKHLNSKSSIATKLVAFAAVEGIMFCSSFAAINWLRQRGMMPGLSLANQWISRDETMHAEFAVMLYYHLQEENRLSRSELTSILVEACEVECAFVEDALPVNLRGMNRDMMIQYVKYVTDMWLSEFDCEAVYGVNNPFPWMQLNDLEGKTNFFEGRVSEYSNANVTAGPKDFDFDF